MKDVQEKLTLGIETSCDETSAAVLRGKRELLSCVIATQIPIHQKYGGVVPEIASRNHILSILPVIEQALAEAGTELAEIDQIAVTYGPGLVGALLVGVSAAKSLAFSLGVPLIGVNHLEGHIFANFLAAEDSQTALYVARRLGWPYRTRRSRGLRDVSPDGQDARRCGGRGI